VAYSLKNTALDGIGWVNIPEPFGYAQESLASSSFILSLAEGFTKKVNTKK
jgi:hypothetical protein